MTKEGSFLMSPDLLRVSAEDLALVMEFRRLESGQVERRLLSAEGEELPDGRSQWQLVSPEEAIAFLKQEGVVSQWFKQITVYRDLL